MSRLTFVDVAKRHDFWPTEYLTAFYPRDAMLARYLRQRRVRLSVRPSGRLSHAGIVPSRAKAGS